MKKIIVSMACFLLGCTLVFADGPTAGEDPQQVVQSVSTALIAELKAQKAEINKDPVPTLHKIVKTVVYPYINLEGMVRMTLGREGNVQWNQASQSEKEEFVDEFTELIVGTYAAALKQYDNQRVEVYPVRGNYTNDQDVEVNSQIFTHSGHPVHITYDMVRKDNKWYVEDFTVEGVSLVSSYQAQFQSIIEDQGLQGLIEVLKSHNDENNNS